MEMEQDSDGPCPPVVLITALVANVLDDLDTSRLDVTAALRLLATTAYQAGYRAGRHDDE